VGNELLPYFEALKLLKEWSTTLLVLQTGILTAVGAFIDKAKLKDGRLSLIASMIFFAASVVIALNVIGTIPWATQRLPELVAKYHDIYKFPNYIGIPIWVLAFGQHTCFIIAIGFFVRFAFVALKK
jgi:hypothetical protein